MANLQRSSLGTFISKGDIPVSRQIKIRVSEECFQQLSSLIPDSGDRHDFIRTAISKELERNL